MLEKYHKEILTCTGCGFCKKLCQIYHHTKRETDSPKGKIMISYGMLTGELKEDEAIVEALQKCTLCKICETTCPSLIKITDIIKAARHDLKNLLPAHKKLIDELNKIDEEVNGKKIFFVGYFAKNLKNTISKISSMMGAVPYYGCCGAPIERIGRKNKMIEKLIYDFKKAGVEEIIFYEPTCEKYFEKEFSTDNIINFLVDIHLNYVGGKYIFHKPPDFDDKMADKAKNLIKRIGELVETEEKCCGGRIEFKRAFPKEAEYMAKDIINEAREKNATIITASPQCYSHLKEYGNVVDLLELIEKAL